MGYICDFDPGFAGIREAQRLEATSGIYAASEQTEQVG